jgi:hypothetical protein
VISGGGILVEELELSWTYNSDSWDTEDGCENPKEGDSPRAAEELFQAVKNISRT